MSATWGLPAELLAVRSSAERSDGHLPFHRLLSVLHQYYGMGRYSVHSRGTMICPNPRDFGPHNPRQRQHPDLAGYSSISVLRAPVAFRQRQHQRGYATPAKTDIVKIVEVGPRDGLQNEKGVIPVEVKVELIDRLVQAGCTTVEAGSFVSPKWVPQMAGTAEILTGINHQPGVHYPVLVPNQKGLDNLFALLDAHPSSPSTSSSASAPSHPIPLTDEVALFTAATDAFTRANLNCTIAESLARLEPVAKAALDRGLRVRGYVSVVIACPYKGKTEYAKVREVASALREMGCYEVSLGDTVGQGTPDEVSAMIEEVKKSVPVEYLAGHFHDTYGTAIANVVRALSHGVRTIDSSVGGLGGCPYSPGATGNVATEDVLYALKDSPYAVAGTHLGGGTIDLGKMVEIGWWISEKLGRKSESRAGRAIRARREREESEKKAKL